MECQPRLNGKYKSILYCISSFEKVLLWKVIRCSYQFFYFLFYISFCINRYHFLKLFRTSLNIIWKILLSQIFLFYQIHTNPSPLMAKIYYSFVPKCHVGLKNWTRVKLSIILRVCFAKFAVWPLLQLHSGQHTFPPY